MAIPSGGGLGRMYVHAGAALPQPRWTLRLDHATAGDREHLGSGAGARRSEHHHDVYHAVLVTSGRGSFLFAGEEVAVRAPWLFLVSPGQRHSFQGGRGLTTSPASA
jgi:mannose-6-phosphate isomerase-like protein (cupin superfamily)